MKTVGEKENCRRPLLRDISIDKYVDMYVYIYLEGYLCMCVQNCHEVAIYTMMCYNKD